MENFTRLSITSGAFAAFAAAFGKLATSPSIYTSFITAFIKNELFLQQIIIWTVQTFLFFAMIATNTLMWSQFSKALSLSPTLVSVILINTLSNFIFTAIIGLLLFGERISIMWSSGIFFLLIGIFMLKNQGEQQQQQQKEQ